MTTAHSLDESAMVQLTNARRLHRKLRVSISLPRRETCLTRRAKIAALREAELNSWLTDGDDFRASMHQPIH